MDRLIKLSDAIEAVWKPQVKPNELIFDALKQAIESEIRNCPTAEASAWIPCSERLPKDWEHVLVCTTVTYTTPIFVDWYVDEIGSWANEGDSVIAWMPLPEPYEPKEADE